jgi:hypothetical protein
MHEVSPSLAAQQDETGIPIIHLKLAKGHK